MAPKSQRVLLRKFPFKRPTLANGGAPPTWQFTLLDQCQLKGKLAWHGFFFHSILSILKIKDFNFLAFSREYVKSIYWSWRICQNYLIVFRECAKSFKRSRRSRWFWSVFVKSRLRIHQKHLGVHRKYAKNILPFMVASLLGGENH